MNLLNPAPLRTFCRTQRSWNPDRCWQFLALAVSILSGVFALAGDAFPSPASPITKSWPLSLTNFLAAALAQNERIQAQLVSFEATNRSARAERGIFEPNLVASADRVDNSRQNSSQQIVSLGTQLFAEQNNLYNGALEQLVPTGARVRLGYNLQDLRNTLQLNRFTKGEYISFVGVNLVQPLLKNAGSGATLTGIRVADLNTEIAWQEYRRAMFQILGGAESAYWGLFLAQEQLRALDESVKVAEGVLEDFKARAAAGNASNLDVLQAKADLSTRRLARGDAAQGLVDARARATGFIATTDSDPRGILTAETPPEMPPPDLGSNDHLHWMITLNPEYVAQRKRIEQEGVRVSYARNQRLPQLDLKASYGLNGLGETPARSWDQASGGNYPSWYLGVELRIPLLGDIRSRNELAAAKARKKSALLGLKDLETQLANALSTTLQRIRHDHEAIGDTETTVRLNQSLLETEMARLDVGRTSARHIMEVERDLLIAKINALGTVVRYNQSVIDLQVLEGTYLAKRSLEYSPYLVAARIRALITGEPKDSNLGHKWQNTPITPASATVLGEP